MHVTSGPAFERAGDVAAVLTKLEEGDVLFIDEIHRLARPVEEVLYPAMEDFELDIVLGKGPAARTLRLDLPRFTLIGATTRTGLITGPLRDRFGYVARLDYYSAADLETIVDAGGRHPRRRRSRPAGAAEIGRRARGTPRIANRLLRRVRDYAEVRGRGVRRRRHRPGRPGAVRRRRARPRQGRPGHPRGGLPPLRGRSGRASTLAISVGEPTETVEDVYEPFLIQRGLLMRTPRGRVATAAAWQHLGLSAPASQAVASDAAPSLFG